MFTNFDKYVTLKKVKNTFFRRYENENFKQRKTFAMDKESVQKGEHIIFSQTTTSDWAMDP